MDNLRIILISALVFILFLMWQAWQEDYGTPTAPPATAQQGPSTTPETPGEPGATDTDLDVPSAPAPAAGSAAATGPAAVPADRVAAADTVRIETDLLRLEVDTRGGVIRSLELKEYPVSLEQPDTPVQLFEVSPAQFYVAQTGLLGEGFAPSHHHEFRAVRDSYVLAEGSDRLEVPLVAESETGVRVTKTLVFERDSYVITVEHRVDNPAEAGTWSGRTYGQFQRTPPVGYGGMRFIYTYTGAILHSQEDRYRKIDFEDMASAPVSVDTPGGWMAMIQHYFGAVWIPDPAAQNHFYTKALGSNRYAAGVVTPALRVEPGSSGTTMLKLYAGPKDQDRLAAAADELDLIVDYGFLFLIAQPLYWALDFIHDFVGNWGWSIVILTLLIKLAFFKLSATSYRSMARLRKLQPKMMELKERYGDDKTKLNQAMMDLYKKEKVNPLGGCLPILVQIPVFIALYWVLIETVDLRQAEFIFWIKDLSVYDPYFVLPIIMGASMLIQQKLNPAPMDPLQQKVMMFLPIVFTVFFLFFPAGLVLYWVVNNVLSIAQQWVITRKIEKEGA